MMVVYLFNKAALFFNSSIHRHSKGILVNVTKNKDSI